MVTPGASHECDTGHGGWPVDASLVGRGHQLAALRRAAGNGFLVVEAVRLPVDEQTPSDDGFVGRVVYAASVDL